MGYQFKTALAAAVSALAFTASPANAANIIYDANVLLNAQGFGNAHRLITVQAKGQSTTESGCVGISGGNIVKSCIAENNPLLKDGNGIANAVGDEVNPFGVNQKFGIPTIGEMGWVKAADIGLLLNAVEPAGDSITVSDVTLKFYKGDNLITALDGQHAFSFTIQGNGQSDFGFVIDQDGRNFLDNLIFKAADYANYRIALETKLSNVHGGPDSWAAVNLNAMAVPEPATWGMMIMGIGMIGGVMRRRQRSAVRYNFA